MRAPGSPRAAPLPPRRESAAEPPAEVLAAQRRFAASLGRGIRHALAHLNATTRYRFTTLYRVDGSVLRGLARFDRENPAIHCVPPHAAPEACYRAAGMQLPSDGDGAAGAAAHPTDLSRRVTTLRLAGGLVVGVVCHSDSRPRLARVARDGDQSDVVAPQLARWVADAGDALH